jgi:AraC-like DNA-binding protein
MRIREFWYDLTMAWESPFDPFQADFLAQLPLAEQVMRLFDSLPTVTFYAKDLNSRFIKVNRAFLENHGLREESEVLGRTDRDLSPPAMAEAYIEEDRRVMSSGKPVESQVWMVYRERKLPRWYVSSKTPLFNPAGKVVGLAGAMYPIDRPNEMAAYMHELFPVVQHIEEHFAQSISMAEMAGLAGLSSTHFNRRFRQLLRMTPMQYLRTVRVQAARRLLIDTTWDLAAIAVDTGFTDQSHFTRLFRQTIGLTPAAYRRRLRAVAANR